MGLKAIFDQCQKLKFCEQRYNSEDYKEIVFFSVDLPKWQQIFESRFGPAQKPAGKEPDADQVSLTENFGGIYRHQTLFTGKENTCQVMVMFWPWEDQKHITLKMAVCQ